MKKQILPFVAMMAINSISYSQVVEKQDPIKKTITQPEKLVFSSQKEKSNQIEKIQKQIDLRVSLGKTEKELAPRYAELKKTQNALITSKTITNEK